MHPSAIQGEARPLASHAPLSLTGFVLLVAALMALNAIATDIILPALPDIGADLAVAMENDRQAVVTAYLIGFGAGQFLMGALSDRYGRRPVLIGGLLVYSAAAVLSARSGDFAALLIARAVQGLGAAAPRVIVTALVRDCYEGRTMARVTSLAMMTFMAAPVIAPSIGQALLLVGDWRLIFALLTLYGVAVLVAAALWLPETLPPEWRRSLDLRALGRSALMVLRERQTVGYAFASGLFFGALFGFINSAQQILAELYALGPWFPVVFGAIAACMAFSAFLNAMLVGRFGMRVLSHAAVLAFTAISATLAGLAALGPPPLWLFLALLGGAMTLVGMVFSNFNALAMEPQAKVAGIASSFIGGATTLIGASAGFVIGRTYDGTVLPLAMGYTLCGLATIGALALTERGRLFRAAPERWRR